MNFNLAEESSRRKVVDDLLVRKPKGQKGQNPVYQIVEYYCYDARKHKNRVECDHSGWGYPEEVLWDLGFRCESDVREYIFDKFYRTEESSHEYYLTSGQRAGITRKTNRLWGRINLSLRRVRQAGNLAGLYKVDVGYANHFFFYGESLAEVDVMAKTMLSAIYPDESITVRFVDRSLPGDILDKNVRAFEKIEHSVHRLRERAEEQLKAAKKAEEQAEFVKTLVTQNLEVAMRAT